MDGGFGGSDGFFCLPVNYHNEFVLVNIHQTYSLVLNRLQGGATLPDELGQHSRNASIETNHAIEFGVIGNWLVHESLRAPNVVRVHRSYLYAAEFTVEDNGGPTI